MGTGRRRAGRRIPGFGRHRHRRSALHRTGRRVVTGQPVFRRLWARHDVRTRSGAVVAFQHPQVGELVLNREKLLVSGTDGMMLVIYHPDAGTDAAEKLVLLAAATHEWRQVTRSCDTGVKVAN
nr:hypothetical protein [Actinoplanes derwentensis]